MGLENKLYPELPEEGEKEAIQLIESFKIQLAKAAEEVIGKLYTDVIPYIQSDSWQNFRNQLLDGLKNYENRKIRAEYDFAEIRKSLYRDYKDEFIKDLNSDLVKEIESLKEENKRLLERRIW